MAVAVGRRSLSRRGRPRTRPIVIVLLLIAMTLTIIDRTTSSGPVDGVADYVRDGFSSVAGIWPFHSTQSALQKENARLQTQLADAQGKLAQAEDAERERKNLSVLAGLPTIDNVPKVIARVTSIGGANFDASIELGKGTDAGIERGMPVVTGVGLVGRVVETSRQRSIVLLMGDTTSNVGVRFVTSGEIGVSVGQGMTKSTRVDLIDLDSHAQPGEIAVTSGLQHSLYPPGIPVGQIISSKAGPQDLRRAVELKPAVKVSTLDSVAVLQWAAK